MPLTFDKPPLDEVAISCAFLPREDLLVPHIGAFWDLVRDRYPKAQHAAPIIETGPDQWQYTPLPLPRVWLINDDTGYLIQIQQDRLIVNWRERASGRPYVRFANVLLEYRRVLDLFSRHVEAHTGRPVQATHYQLTYINVIEKGNGWSSIEDLHRVFPHMPWDSKDRFLPVPEDIAWRGNFRLPDGLGTMTANFLPGVKKSNQVPVYKFELIASSGAARGSPPDFNVWIEVAHEFIVRGFKDLTSKEMHVNHWLLQQEQS
jgi:uncharacterized protein (TIGR04255 family)